MVMAQSPVRETAQIIPFPTKVRGGKASPREGVDRVAAVMSDFGSGWYHDAAVQEDVRKRPPH
jgi:hypothetical protein